jgi:uncharacterized protein YggU (UPF0235/DUF167 family)
MKIFVKAKPNAREEKVEKIDESYFVVAVKELPEKGRANLAIRNALAVYFRIGTKNVKIISGFTSRNKIIEINNN